MAFRCDGIQYKIRKGDSLYNISARYHVPLALILRVNPFMDIYNLQVGDVICIPMHMQSPMERVIPYVIQDMETIGDILNKFDLELEDILRYNNLNSILLKPGTTLMLPTENGNYKDMEYDEDYEEDSDEKFEDYED